MAGLLFTTTFNPNMTAMVAAGLQQIDPEESVKQGSSVSTQQRKLKQRFPDYYAHYGYE